MTTPDDRLDDLKRAWSEVTPPERSTDLADADLATRASVEWLRGAWKRQPLAIPARVRPARRLPVARVAAAAALLVASLVAAWAVTHDRGAPDDPRRTTVATEPRPAAVDAFAAVAATRAALTLPATFGSGPPVDCSAAKAPVERLSCAFRASRAGDYSDTIRYASPVADDPTATAADRCAALTHIVVAEYGLGRSDEAQRHEARLAHALAMH